MGWIDDSEAQASALADAAAEGAAVATLGVFDQGYYDRFGFGTGADDHVVSFDPATLNVAIPDRPPVRIGVGDHREVYDLLLRRHRRHGSVVLSLPEWFAGAFGELDAPLGLGFRDPGGRLTHCLLGSMSGHHGPLTVEWLIHERPEQLLDLLGLLKALGDPARSVTINREPPGVQLQSLITEPLRQLTRANLGDEPEVAEGLPGGSSPVLDASVAGLTRLWLGVRPATGLTVTDRLDGPPELIAALDMAFCLPPPLPDWPY